MPEFPEKVKGQTVRSGHPQGASEAGGAEGVALADVAGLEALAEPADPLLRRAVGERVRTT